MRNVTIALGSLIILLFSGCLSSRSLMAMNVNNMKMMQKEALGEVSDSELGMDIISTSELQKIIVVNANSNDIVKRSKEWIKSNFTSEQDAIKNESKEIIQGSGSLLLPIETKISTNNVKYYFEYSIDIKDNKIRMTIKQPYYYVIRTNNSGINKSEPMLTYVSPEDLRFISRAIKKQNILGTLTRTIEGININSNDW
jgi:Domain of unknown function (DUF4468) with TBP-like fold